MKNKVKEFIYPENSNLSHYDNLKIANRSDFDNFLHQAIFNSIDCLSKRFIKDLHNNYGKEIFESNMLNLVSDETTIEAAIISGLKQQGIMANTLRNPEMIYRAYNFIKPGTLLPEFSKKLYLIQQLGIDEFGVETKYVLNPVFFGFKLSFDLYINALFCSEHSEEFELGMKSILVDKYGEEFGEIYDYVSYVGGKAAYEGRQKGDKEDETFIDGVMTISGIENKTIFHNFIYESAMITAGNHAKIVKEA